MKGRRAEVAKRDLVMREIFFIVISSTSALFEVEVDTI